MENVKLSTFLGALAALPEVFEKNPHGAMMVCGLVALSVICCTIVMVKKQG
jgi:hypothetical protein